MGFSYDRRDELPIGTVLPETGESFFAEHMGDTGGMDIVVHFHTDNLALDPSALGERDGRYRVPSRDLSCY